MPTGFKVLKRLIRKFIIHFETISENDTDQIFTSGSKVLDILDCATYAQRKVNNLTFFENYVTLEVYIIEITDNTKTILA